MIWIDEEVQDRLAIFSNGDAFKNKVRFERAASLDILEAKKGPPMKSIIK